MLSDDENNNKSALQRYIILHYVMERQTRMAAEKNTVKIFQCFFFDSIKMASINSIKSICYAIDMLLRSAR